MSRLLTLFLTLVALSETTISSGQQNFLLRTEKRLPRDKQWEDLQRRYNYIPAEMLTVAENELDSTISGRDCYKFICNSDTTRFLAFFLQRMDDPSYNKLIRFGRTVHRHYQPSENDSV